MKLARIIAPFNLSTVLFILSYASLKDIGKGQEDSLRIEQEVSFDMEFRILAILGILGAALIAGGIVTYRAYRGSTRVGFRALGAALIAKEHNGS